MWVDDYIDWIKPSSGCCRTFRTKDCVEYGDVSKCAFCAADENAPILGQNSCKNCIPLLSITEDEDGNPEIVSNTTITSKDFKTYLDYFLDGLYKLLLSFNHKNFKIIRMSFARKEDMQAMGMR